VLYERALRIGDIDDSGRQISLRLKCCTRCMVCRQFLSHLYAQADTCRRRRGDVKDLGSLGKNSVVNSIPGAKQDSGISLGSNLEVPLVQIARNDGMLRVPGLVPVF